VERHLIYHVDKSLSVIATQALDHFDFIAVGEDGLYQGDALICGEGTINQALPRWNAAVRDESVGLIYAVNDL